MIIKTSELKGIALDWAVAKCEGMFVRYPKMEGATQFKRSWNALDPSYFVRASSNWEHGGPIIEREYIDLNRNDAGTWYASTVVNYTMVDADGETPLIAAMRCYVASKLGDTVDIPEEFSMMNPNHFRKMLNNKWTYWGY
jgi:hypothetical protein